MKWIHTAAAALAATGLSGAASAYSPYHQLRQDHASIDDMVAAMPSSDLHGSFNRISAMFERSSVKDLTAGAGNRGELPGNFEAGMAAAIADLQADIKDGLGSLTLEQKCTLVQVVDVVLVGRLVELYEGYDVPACIPTEEHPCPDIRPALVKNVDQVSGGLRLPVVSMLTQYNDEVDPDVAVPGTLTHKNYGTVIDLVRETYLTIKGVESIDD